jgi:hypothetical protein
MNERIKAVAAQSEIKFEATLEHSGIDTAVIIPADLEKFAELLIREYEQFLPEICPWSKADEKGPMKGWHVQFVARKHFGIE